MSEVDRAELRRLLDEATPGPWVAEGSQIWGPDGVLVAAVREHSTLADRPDALIVVAAVNALPDLLDALEQAETAIELVDEVMGALEAILPDLLAQAWDEGAAAAWERSTAAVNAERYHWRSAGEPLNPYRQEC